MMAGVLVRNVETCAAIDNYHNSDGSITSMVLVWTVALGLGLSEKARQTQRIRCPEKIGVLIVEANKTLDGCQAIPFHIHLSIILF